MPYQRTEKVPTAEATGPEAATSTAAGGEPEIGIEGGRRRPPEVRYLGFRTTAAGREYVLRVTDGLEARLFVMLITHEAFASRQARFQDGPDLCFAKLRRELQADPALLPSPRLVLTAQEVLDYRDAREKRPPGRKRTG